MDPFELWDLGYAADNGFGAMDLTGISPEYYDIMNMAVGGDYGWSPEMETWGLGYAGDNGAGPMSLEGDSPWSWLENPVAGWNTSNIPWGALALGGATIGARWSVMARKGHLGRQHNCASAAHDEKSRNDRFFCAGLHEKKIRLAVG